VIVEKLYLGVALFFDSGLAVRLRKDTSRNGTPAKKLGTDQQLLKRSVE
jgi:hypothetical protein